MSSRFTLHIPILSMLPVASPPVSLSEQLLPTHIHKLAPRRLPTNPLFLQLSTLRHVAAPVCKLHVPSSDLTHCSFQVHRAIHLLTGLSIDYYMPIHVYSHYLHFGLLKIHSESFLKLLCHSCNALCSSFLYLPPMLYRQHTVSSSVLPVQTPFY